VTRTCALCGWRDSVDTTDYDGRLVPACGVCLEPPSVADDYEYEPADLADRFAPSVERTVSNHDSRDAVYGVIKRMGCATAGEVAEALGVADWRTREYDVVTNHLRLLVKRGCLAFEVETGSNGSPVRRYRPTEKVPEARLRTRRSEIVRLKLAGLRNSEIVERLGATKAAVCTAIYQARQRGELPQRAA
jgi:hypothetical protein